MRKFAEPFYRSMAWRRARDAYVKERTSVDGGLCELCGEALGEEVHHKIFLRPENIADPEITLNPDNFAFLCYPCHKRQHDAARRVSQLAARERASKARTLQRAGYYVTEDGDVQPFRAHIVWGCPGSGKTTYVREHKAPGDVVVDLDLIGRALSMADKTDVPRNVERIAYDLRDFLYERIKSRELDCHEAWVVAGLPKKEKRESVADELGADLIFIDATFQECYQHALHDAERKDKAMQLAIIERWFKDYEP